MLVYMFLKQPEATAAFANVFLKLVRNIPYALPVLLNKGCKYMET